MPDIALDPDPGPPVLVTRSRADNARLAALLREHGVPVLAWTSTRARLLRPPAGAAPLAADVVAADVVAFTSRRGVLAARALLGRAHWDALAGRRLAAVGPGTAALLERLGPRAEWIGEGGAEALGASLLADLPAGSRVLFLRGAQAADAPADALRAAGLLVEDRRVYEHVAPCRPAALPRRPAAVACASPSAARRVLRFHPGLAEAPFAAIGRTTADALREMGVSHVTTAATPTNEGLRDAVLALLGALPAGPAAAAAR